MLLLRTIPGGMPAHRTGVPVSSSNGRGGQKSRFSGVHWGGVVVRTATLRLRLRLGLRLRYRGSGRSGGPPSASRRGNSRPGEGMDEIPEGGRRPAIVAVVVVLGRLEGRPGGIGLPVSHRRGEVLAGWKIEDGEEGMEERRNEERKKFMSRSRSSHDAGQ